MREEALSASSLSSLGCRGSEPADTNYEDYVAVQAVRQQLVSD